MSLSKVFFSAGHLSLFCSVFVIWCCFYGFQHYFPEFKSSTLEFDVVRSLILIVTSFAIGTAWFPLIPLTIIMQIYLSLRLLANAQRYLALIPNLRKLVYCAILFIVFLADYNSLKTPPGYSVASLIGTSGGGTVVPTSLALSGAIIGFVLVINNLRISKANALLASSLPGALLAYWIFSMSSNPNSPGYSVEKFSLLVAIIGLPFLLAFCIDLISKFSTNNFGQIVSPLLVTAALIHVSWGINSFPRIDLVDRTNWDINYLPILLEQTSENPQSQILCLSPSGEFDMTAYTCSRFASAFQFREFGTNNLARRWRSQVLGGNLDPANIPESTDFLVPDVVKNFISNGGSMIVILTPGPFGKIINRDDSERLKKLPWEQITVIE